AIVGSKCRWSGTHGRVRRHHDAALFGIVGNDVADDDIVPAFRGLIAEQNSVSVTSNQIAGYDRAHRSNQVKSATAVSAFIGLVGWLGGARGARAALGRDRVRVC